MAGCVCGQHESISARVDNRSPHGILLAVRDWLDTFSTDSTYSLYSGMRIWVNEMNKACGMRSMLFPNIATRTTSMDNSPITCHLVDSSIRTHHSGHSSDAKLFAARDGVQDVYAV
jgi:hypothetical protein